MKIKNKSKSIFIKISLAFSIFVFFFEYAHSQGTLEFNQVILISTVTPDTVPANKVWKVEHFLQKGSFKFDYINATNCATTSPERFHSVAINGVTYFLKQFGISNTNGAPVSLFGVNGSLWLPEGAIIQLQCDNDLLSIIEFNIVP